MKANRLKTIATSFPIALAVAIALTMYFPQEPFNGVVYGASNEPFRGFKNCEWPGKLDAFASKLVRESTPIIKKENVWIYEYKSTILGLPSKAIAIGVCDKNGVRNCGWGSYVAMIFDMPVSESKRILQKKFGLDFTIEKRSEDAEVTLRPLLTKGDTPNQSWLVCDPGAL